MSTVDMTNVSKTGDSAGRLGRTEGAASRGGTSQKGGPATERASPVDAVSLSESAAEIEALEGQLKSLSGVDQARVDSIRESIADGSYAIDPDKVISGLLSAEKALL